MSRTGILYLSAGLLLFGSSAYSQTIGVENQTNSAAQAGSSSIAISGGSNSPSKIKTSVPAFAPGLVAAGVHSCAGSTSVGVGSTGWGFGFGSTYEMRDCNRRAFAAALLGMGQNRAALDLICLNKEVRSSLNATGVVCPSQTQTSRAAAPARRTIFSSAAAEPAPAAIPAATARTASAQPAGQRRTYSAKALGLSSADLRKRGCVLRTTSQNGRAWHCPQPVM